MALYFFIKFLVHKHRCLQGGEVVHYPPPPWVKFWGGGDFKEVITPKTFVLVQAINDHQQVRQAQFSLRYKIKGLPRIDIIMQLIYLHPYFIA